MDHCIGLDVAKTTLDVASLPDGETWTVANDDQGLGDLVPRLVAPAPFPCLCSFIFGGSLSAASNAPHALNTVWPALD